MWARWLRKVGFFGNSSDEEKRKWNCKMVHQPGGLWSTASLAVPAVFLFALKYNSTTLNTEDRQARIGKHAFNYCNNLFDDVSFYFRNKATGILAEVPTNYVSISVSHRSAATASSKRIVVTNLLVFLLVKPAEHSPSLWKISTKFCKRIFCETETYFFLSGLCVVC